MPYVPEGLPEGDRADVSVLDQEEGVGVKYRIIKARTTEDLEKEVQRLLGYDWLPCGGVSVAAVRNEGKKLERWFIQAMVFGM